jgi:hypothetical protein
MDSVHADIDGRAGQARSPTSPAVAATADAAHASAQAARKQVRDEWLALYATFSPAQKAVVRDAVRTRVDRMDAFREKMKEKFQQRQGGNS